MNNIFLLNRKLNSLLKGNKFCGDFFKCTIMATSNTVVEQLNNDKESFHIGIKEMHVF